MRKLSFLVAFGGILLFQACKEVGPQIDFGPSGNDTTYKTTPETADVKKVLAEEFTGVSCPPCPGGHEQMASIKTTLNNNLVVIAYHILNYPQAYPIDDELHKSKYDFRTEDATKVGSEIFGGIGAMPLAGFDRVPQDGSALLGKGQWSSAAQTAANVPSPLNIHITSSFDATTREMTAVIQVAYTASVSNDQNLTIAITEDDIEDLQKRDLTVVEDYKHEHVLRKILTPIVGKKIPNDMAKEPGLVYQTTYTDTLDASWNADNCHVVAFVTNNSASDRTVVNAQEVKVNGL
ncbi:MAG: Omp28-related outer membrane protein [Chitinophagaceae bacterium]|nr:Omp28-related outer membrane protein [Chitinophagaceae bacterium]MCB9045724.1 Omp28-related outer membrane protein [Chitinophagales bacterium]